MLDQKFKDVTIDGQEFRIGLFSSVIGSMTMMQVRHMLTNETIYALVRDNCFDVCSVILDKGGTKVPLKMFSKTGAKWLVPALDTGVESKLIMEVISFNLDPFFVKPGTETDTTGTRDTSQPLSQKV